MRGARRDPRSATDVAAELRSRRDALGVIMGAGAWVLSGCGSSGDAPNESVGGGTARPRGGPELCANGFVGGTFVRVLPFDGEGPAPLDVATGSGLDGRLYGDLSALPIGSSVTPTDRFYVRTRYPDRLDPAAPWSIRLRGLVASEAALTLDELAPSVGPRGVYLMECSGNGGGAFFGMVSAAVWEGAPLAALLDTLDARIGRLPSATRVLVSGFDDHAQPSARSTAGASWIFTLAELAETGAFLATRMNGDVLTPDHGFPVRLVVPGWYGCTCIKWVNEIVLVDDSAPATSQMQEFASRTMQRGVPELARDYLPAEIDQTAMPVRVEEWRVAGRSVLRVIGIAWGGKRPTDALSIRMRDDLPYERVGLCAPVTTTATWSWWSYAFEPSRAGAYLMRLRVDDPSIRTRRLDTGFYARQVTLTLA